MVHIALLGPLMVARDGEGPIDLGTGRRRSVLLVLILHRNEAVLAEHLINAVWGPAPPPSARKALHVAVSRLRKELRAADIDPAILRTVAGGYVLDVADDELDVIEAADAVGAAHEALGRGDPRRAVTRAGSALSLWRGPPLADVAFEDFAQPEIARLEERRVTLVEAKAEGLIALGDLHPATEELQQVVDDHPLRERSRALLMIALYRGERQTEALEHYSRLRRMLDEEYGLRPAPGLRELQLQMLRQDPALDGPRYPVVTGA
jgi:DNA-binding SARP family transcriptional activator